MDHSPQLANSTVFNQNLQGKTFSTLNRCWFFSLPGQFWCLWDKRKEVKRKMDLHKITFILEVQQTFFLICCWTGAQAHSHGNLYAVPGGTTLARVIRSPTVNQKIASNFASQIGSLLVELSHFPNLYNADILIETYFMAVEVAIRLQHQWTQYCFQQNTKS